jgi:hypothetical protein
MTTLLMMIMALRLRTMMMVILAGGPWSIRIWVGMRW